MSRNPTFDWYLRSVNPVIMKLVTQEKELIKNEKDNMISMMPMTLVLFNFIRETNKYN